MRDEPDKSAGEPQPQEGSQSESVFGIGNGIDVSQMNLSKKRDRLERRRAAGRRMDTRTSGNAGRKISSRDPTGKNDISIDATIRAAAPHQKTRARNGLMIAIRDEDIRENTRVGKVRTASVFVVDASGSMGTERRMESAKGAILSLLTDSYQQRDKIGMVAFRGDSADLVLPLSTSVDLAQKRLEEIPTGGKTPLSAGLMKGMDVLMREKRKKNEVIPMLVVITDGRANVPVSGDIRDEISSISEELRSRGIHTVVIDTEAQGRSFLRMQLGYCRLIAESSGGRYYAINDLSPENLREISLGERGRITGAVS